MGLNINPDFQRGHVWTKEQQTAFLEFWFRGGVINNAIYFNCPRFTSGAVSFDKFVLVDGKQRLQAILDFLDNKIRIFGHYFKEFEDKIGVGTIRLRFCVAELATRKEILEWYISINAGGTPHTKEELNKVRALLKKEIDNP